MTPDPDFVANARIASTDELAQIVDAAAPPHADHRPDRAFAPQGIGFPILLGLMGVTIAAVGASAT